MAQTLRYLDALLASAPDNVTGLITAEALLDRDVSNAQGAGFLADTTPVDLSINPDIPLSINPLLTAAEHVGAGWDTDGNNLQYPNYSLGTGTVVPAGYSKLCSFVGVLSLEKLAAGVDTYDINFTKDGIAFGVPESIIFDGSTSQVVTVLASAIVDISTTPVFGIQITGIVTGDDIRVHSFQQTVNDKLLWVSP